MEKESADNRAPLYQRSTFSLSLRKFEFDEALLALKDVRDDWEKAKILALTNTFPYYLSLIDVSKTFDENLNRLFYDRTAIFADDPSKIITSDTAKGGLYASLITAISLGHDTLEKLSTYLRTDSSKVAKYLKELTADSVLIRRTTFQSKRNVHYEIFDPMLAFF